jgi:hypothetical protein
MIFSMCFWTWFASILLRIFTHIFTRIFVCSFFLVCYCFLIYFQHQGNSDFVELVALIHFLLYRLVKEHWC